MLYSSAGLCGTCLLNAGFRPGSRGPFFSAKGPKTIDAPSSLIEEEGREPGEERTNSPGSDKVREMRKASLPGASRQTSDYRREASVEDLKVGRGGDRVIL